MIETRLKNLSTALSLNYGELGGVIKVSSALLPNAKNVQNILPRLRELLFPGYFGTRSSGSCGSSGSSGSDGEEKRGYDCRITNLLKEIHSDLSREIALALPHIKQFEHESQKEIAHHAEWFAHAFLDELVEIRILLASDAEAAFDGDPAAFGIDEIIASYPGFFAITIYRLAHKLHQLGVPLIPRIWSEYAHGKTGIDIHPGAKIGHHFFIDHGTGIVIGETTIVGNFVKIYQGVTLGGISTRGGQALRGTKRHPTVEDYVTIYSGASIFGGATTIGKHCVIGSNVFISSSIPEYTKVSVKNPELQYRNNIQFRSELEQDEFWGWVI